MAREWRYRRGMSSDVLEIARARALIRGGDAQRIREQSGLTRSEVARSLEVDDSTVARWETGARTPRGEDAVRYARLLRELRKVGA